MPASFCYYCSLFSSSSFYHSLFKMVSLMPFPCMNKALLPLLTKILSLMYLLAQAREFTVGAAPMLEPSQTTTPSMTHLSSDLIQKLMKHYLGPLIAIYDGITWGLSVLTAFFSQGNIFFELFTGNFQNNLYIVNDLKLYLSISQSQKNTKIANPMESVTMELHPNGSKKLNWARVKFLDVNLRNFLIPIFSPFAQTSSPAGD